MPRVGKKSGSSKQQAAAGIPVDSMAENSAQTRLNTSTLPDSQSLEPCTPTQSPTRPHIGYFGRSSCPCWRCVRNMGPLQRRKEFVEQDIADILLDAWQARGTEGVDNQWAHTTQAKAITDAADQQNLEVLEEAFRNLRDEHNPITVGDVADRILIYSVQKGWCAACKLCVKFNANINAQDEDNGGTPLMYAIHNAHDAIVETLLQLGADMEHKEQQGYTPLMVACLSDNATACEILLESKAQLDSTDSKGRTALSMACRDEDGMSVLEHAEQNDRRQVVSLIKRVQLGNQMRQRQKKKNQHKENGMTMEEFMHREEKAKETMVELLQEIEKEFECAESRKARQRAKRSAKKSERKSARRKDLEGEPEARCSPASKCDKSPEASKGKASGLESQQCSLTEATSSPSQSTVVEERDRFGCTQQEAAELDSFRRVLLEGRVSPEEAVWQWCSDDNGDIKPEQLRKMWEFMTDAAGVCRAAEKQAVFLNVISVLLEVCQIHGISVKQGKKVKARLEKVSVLRDELEKAVKPPVVASRLEAALDSTRSVASMFEEELLDRARKIMQKIEAGKCDPPVDRPHSLETSGGAGDGSATSPDDPRPHQRIRQLAQLPPPNPPALRTPAGSQEDALARHAGHGYSPGSGALPPAPQHLVQSALQRGLLHSSSSPMLAHTADDSQKPRVPQAAPVPPAPSLHPNPSAGTQRVVELLGQDLVGALDSVLANSMPASAPQSNLALINGHRVPLPPHKVPQPQAQMRTQNLSPGLHPYGNGNLFHSIGSTSRPPSVPPPAPPVSSIMDAYTSKAAVRNGVKVHHAPHPQYPAAYLRTFPESKVDAPHVRTAPSHMNGYALVPRLSAEALASSKDGPPYGPLSMRAAPFLPSNKSPAGGQGLQHSISTSSDIQNLAMHHLVQNGSESLGSLPSAHDDASFTSSTRALPNDPFGLDSPASNVGVANDAHLLRCSMSAASDSVAGAASGKPRSAEATVDFVPYLHPTPRHDLPVQQEKGIAETLLGMSLFDALEGSSS